ncbi:MAG: septum formation protein, partial [bacterium]
RKDYLERYGFDFRILSADIDEIINENESPTDFVIRMAKEKGEAVQAQCSSNEIIISADTVVVHQDQVLGKPVDKQDAIQMLKRLNGQQHTVVSGISLIDQSSELKIQQHFDTKVQFYQVPANLIESYVNTGEPLDKAGSYSIQSLGTFMVQSIEGSYNNVVGFPIEVVLQHFIQQQWIEPLI